MRGIFAKRSVVVEPGQALSGVASAARTLCIAHGRVWITVEGVTQDYFLRAGDTLVAEPGRLVVVESDRKAGLEVLGATADCVRHGVRQWLWSKGHRLLHRNAVCNAQDMPRNCGAC